MGHALETKGRKLRQHGSDRHVKDCNLLVIYKSVAATGGWVILGVDALMTGDAPRTAPQWTCTGRTPAVYTQNALYKYGPTSTSLRHHSFTGLYHHHCSACTISVRCSPKTSREACPIQARWHLLHWGCEMIGRSSTWPAKRCETSCRPFPITLRNCRNKNSPGISWLIRSYQVAEQDRS